MKCRFINTKNRVTIKNFNGLTIYAFKIKDNTEKEFFTRIRELHGLLKNENINYESNYIFEQYIDGKCLIYVKLVRDLTNEKTHQLKVQE